MGYSAVVVTDGQSVDVVSPGAPAFVGVVQGSNREWTVDVQLPLVDADGSELTGLAGLALATLPMAEGINPFTGLSMAEIRALPGVLVQDVALTVGDAGGLKSIAVPVMNLGGWQAFAAAVTD